jgi:hypothetical protein
VRYTEEQILAVLRGVRAPTGLILAQPEQPYMPRAFIDGRIAVVDGIEVARMAGTHHLHMENAPAVAEAMMGFKRAMP